MTTSSPLNSKSNARLFLTQLFEMMDRLEKKAHSISTNDLVQLFSLDTILAATERLILARAEFQAAGKPTEVDLGFHYTHIDNVASIRAHGLLSLSERNNKQIKAVIDNGTSYGDGIYTAADPRAYHGAYGGVGIIVARLLGHNKDFVRRTTVSSCDSATEKRNERGEIVVLFSSRQCIPILQFDANQIAPENVFCPLNQTLDEFHAALQAVIHKSFGVLATRPFDSLFKMLWTKPGEKLAMFKGQLCKTIRYSKQPSNYWKSLPDSPLVIFNGEPKSCQICLGNYCVSPFVKLSGCNHVFHQSCIDQFSPACPVCWKTTNGEHFGKMPSGVMIVQLSSTAACAGNGSTEVVVIEYIVVEYIVPSDLQEPYHPNPGVKHGEAHRVAYLPRSIQGYHLLSRLRYAFSHGLTFKVGTSITTGLSNAVTWASIHHKTALSGGPDCHGFPDPDYIDTCNRELDALCVPAARSLPFYIDCIPMCD